jgi:hypothetical protein
MTVDEGPRPQGTGDERRSRHAGSMILWSSLTVALFGWLSVDAIMLRIAPSYVVTHAWNAHSLPCGRSTTYGLAAVVGACCDLRDPWGKPFCAVPDSQVGYGAVWPDSEAYIVYSAGPDGVDEGGRGDDVDLLPPGDRSCDIVLVCDEPFAALGLATLALIALRWLRSTDRSCEFVYRGVLGAMAGSCCLWMVRPIGDRMPFDRMPCLDQWGAFSQFLTPRALSGSFIGLVTLLGSLSALPRRKSVKG